MARYLVMKRDNDIGVVKEEQSQIVSLSFGDFIEELASPHYERYGVRSIDYWDIDEEATMLRPLKGFGTFAVIQLMISWDFLVHLIRMMELISNGQSLDSSN